MALPVLSFDAMLMSVEHKEFTPSTGNNAGTKYLTTHLKFACVGGADLLLKSPGHIEMDPASMRRDLHWDLELTPTIVQGDTKFKVSKITGGKIKA